jgi:hypothetical protein
MHSLFYLISFLLLSILVPSDFQLGEDIFLRGIHTYGIHAASFTAPGVLSPGVRRPYYEYLFISGLFNDAFSSSVSNFKTINE